MCLGLVPVKFSHDSAILNKDRMASDKTDKMLQAQIVRSDISKLSYQYMQFSQTYVYENLYIS